MTLPELYAALERHDWFFIMADDHSAWTAGQQAHTQLWRDAGRIGAQGLRLMLDYQSFKSSGPAFDKPQLPKPKLEDYV